jgi:hypothetical protein
VAVNADEMLENIAKGLGVEDLELLVAEAIMLIDQRSLRIVACNRLSGAPDQLAQSASKQTQ